MGIQRGLTVSGWFAAAGFLLVLTAAAQSNLPDGPGKSVVEKVCSGCHAFTVITQVHATKEHWEEVVENMVSRGAEGNDEELDKVVAYLATHFGPVNEPHQKVNVNRATAEDLSKALSISQESANAIVQHRTKNGSFKNLEALKSVPGIDVKRIDEKKDWIEF